MDGVGGEGPRGAWEPGGESVVDPASLALGTVTVKWAQGAQLVSSSHGRNRGAPRDLRVTPSFTESLRAICVPFKTSTAVLQINADHKYRAQPLLNESSVIKASNPECACESCG